jgi:hypothetical protein
VTVANAPPTVTITAPTDFYWVDAVPGGSLAFDTDSVGPGTYTLVVRAFDDSFTLYESAPIEVTVTG